MALMILTVELAVTRHFTDAEAEAFLGYVGSSVEQAVEAAANGVVDAAKSADVALADAVKVTVHD